MANEFDNREARDSVLRVRVSQSERQAVEAQAKQTGKSLSDVTREALRVYLAVYGGALR